MINRLALILFCVFVTFALIGCSNETSEKTEELNKGNSEVGQGEKLKIAYSAQPPVLDPYVTSAIATSDIMRNVYETLLTFDSNYNIQPMLAESYEQSEDGKVITFHLRKGILFHNGKEMIAEDVIASMNRWKGIPGSKAADQFSDAVFEAKDDYTVVMSLPEPLSTTLTVLAYSSAAFPAIMPKEIVENTNPEGVDEYIGTGPFKFNEWKQDQYAHLIKYDDYQHLNEPADGLAGKKEALVDNLYFYFVTDPSTRVAGIQSGEYDIAHAVPFDNVDELEGDGSINSHTYPGGYISAVFNLKQGIFKDIKAREAIAAALDMDSILKAAYSDEKYYNLNHNMMMYHQLEQWNSKKGLDKYNQKDPEKAKRLLEEIGYQGEVVNIVTTRDYDDQYSAAVVVQEQLKNIGVNVKLEVYDWSTLLEHWATFVDKDKESEIEIFMMAFVAVPEPSMLFFARDNYQGGPEGTEFRQLISDFRGQPSLDSAKEFYGTLQEWYWDNIPVAKIGDYARIAASRDNVKNLQFQDGFILTNVSNSK